MRYAYVTANVLDLWAEPKYNCERASQLLFGDLAQIGKKRDRFVEVRQPDGYRGWVDARFLAEITRIQYDRYLKAAVWTIAVSQTMLFDRKGASIPPHVVYYGTKIIARTGRGSLTGIILPDGGSALVKATALLKQPHSATAGQIVREARRFLGVPYLWGGVTPAGWDCSGFVRAIFGRFGYDLPRDTKDQVKVGRLIDRREVRPGDLLFFNRHVGIALGKARIIHSSVSGGGVRVNSLQAGDSDYRADLDRDFSQARRIL